MVESDADAAQDMNAFLVEGLGLRVNGYPWHNRAAKIGLTTRIIDYVNLRRELTRI